MWDVKEVSHGTVETMILDLYQQQRKLRNMAHDFNIPNADALNRTLIASSKSDGASNCTKMLQHYRKTDEV